MVGFSAFFEIFKFFMVIPFLFSSFQSGERRRTRGSIIFDSFFDTLPQAVMERVR